MSELKDPTNKIVPLEDGQWLVLPDDPEDLEELLAKFQDGAEKLADLQNEQDATENAEPGGAAIGVFAEGELEEVVPIPDEVIEAAVADVESLGEMPGIEEIVKSAKEFQREANEILADHEPKPDERLTFALSYSVDVITRKGNPTTQKWDKAEFTRARSLEAEGKNRKTVIRWIDRNLKRLEKQEAKEGQEEPESAPEEPASDPVVNGEQLPLLPEKPIKPPIASPIQLSAVADQVEHIPNQPQSFVKSLRLVQMYPILVRVVNGKMKLVDGRRRVKAFVQIANEQGQSLDEVMISASIFPGDAWSHDEVMAIKANAERSPNLLNELQLIESLLSQGYTEKQIGLATGMKLKTISKRLKLATPPYGTLSPNLRQALDEGRIKPGVAADAAKLPEEKQDELAAKEGRITGKDVTEAKQVKIEFLADLLEGFESVSDEPEPVETRLGDVELQALIESNTGVVREALMELRTWRQRYGSQEKKDGRTESEEAATV